MTSIRHHIDAVAKLDEAIWPFGRKAVATTPVEPARPEPAAPPALPATAARPAIPFSTQAWTDLVDLISRITRNEHGSGTVMGVGAFRPQVREIMRLAYLNRGNRIGEKATEFLQRHRNAPWMSQSDARMIAALPAA